MKPCILVCAAILALTTSATAQTPADIFTSFEVISNASGNVSHTADWYREASLDPSSLQPNQLAGGSFFIVAGPTDVTNFTWAAQRWIFSHFTPLSRVAGNSYEIRFTGTDNKGAAWFGGAVIDVPFQIWLLGATPEDASDDVRMIPRIYDANGDGVFSFGLDHQASPGDDDPSSDWIAFAMPADASPGQAGYDQFVSAGALDVSTTELHLARVVLMNWDRRQGESAPGQGDGPVDAMPEPGTIFRIVTDDVLAPECIVVDFHVGSPSTFSLRIHEPVSGVDSMGPIRLTNATLDVPPISPGEKSPITMTGTITDRTYAVVEFQVSDTKGNTAVCDKPRMHEVAIHDAGNLVLAMQPNSNFGTFGTSFPTESGLSALWPKVGGASHLFAANLWVGTTIGSEKRVMDNHFGPFDWTRTPGSPVTYATTISDQDIGVTYDDRSASSAPIGLRVHQQSFQWADPSRDDFVVLKYTFENTGVNGDLTGVYPAIWTDTDIGDYTDHVAYDASRGMVYGFDDGGLGGYVGIKVLGGAAHAAAAYINAWGHNPEDDAQKYDLITAGTASFPSGVADMRMIVTAQPFDLPLGGSHTVVFAMVLGDDLVELQANADVMETVYAAHLVDDDADGVSNTVEGGVPNPDGSGTGDGNGDGISDVEQDYVTSLPNGVDGDYVTFESAPGTRLIGVVATASIPDPDYAPAQSEFPAGFLSFGINGVESGAATTVTIWSNKVVDSYWKYGPTPDDPTDHWYEFLYDGQTGAEIFPDGRIVLHLVDGGRGDHDLTANGRIQDPGAPVLLGVESAFASLERQLVQLGLKKGHENSLREKLDHAAAKYAEGRSHAAVGMLNAFVNQVRAFARDAGILTVNQASRLEHAARVIIGQIEVFAGKRGTAETADAAVERPARMALDQNYPNPFNPRTTIQFALTDDVHVRLAVYDLLGRPVRVLAEGVRSAGTHAVAFDATGLPTGTYFYRLETPTGSFTRRMTITK